MSRKLKVFRTAIGFDDAYVAAPSRKEALAAWGAVADLFARGVAEEVTDAKLTRAPLLQPGEVIRLSRGNLAEHLRALPKKRNKAPPSAVTAPSKPAKPRPAPSRAKVDAAETALAALRARQADEIEALRMKQAKERATLERKRDQARLTYRAALDRWSE